jgi:hypothetical protein
MAEITTFTTVFNSSSLIVLLLSRYCLKVNTFPLFRPGVNLSLLDKKIIDAPGASRIMPNLWSGVLKAKKVALFGAIENSAALKNVSCYFSSQSSDCETILESYNHRISREVVLLHEYCSSTVIQYLLSLG